MKKRIGSDQKKNRKIENGNEQTIDKNFQCKKPQGQMHKNQKWKQKKRTDQEWKKETEKIDGKGYEVVKQHDKDQEAQ